MGFIVAVGDFVNSGLLMAYFRFKVQKEERIFGECSLFTALMAQITYYIEVAFRVVTICVTVYQSLILHTKMGNYCMNQDGVLWLEGRWLHALIVLQIVKNVMLLFWRAPSIHLQEANEEGYDVISNQD